MKLFIDDIKKETWLADKVQQRLPALMSLKRPNYFLFTYNLVETESGINIIGYRSLFEINDLVYRNLNAEHIAWFQEPFDTSSYLFYSLLMYCMDTDEEKEKLKNLFMKYRSMDMENNKKNLKQVLKGSFEIKSQISFSDAMYKVFGFNKEPVPGLVMVYDLIDQYTKRNYGKSIYGNYLFKIVRAVKNPNQGLLPEYPNTTMRYLIVGEKALPTDPALERAKALWREGNKPYEIYLETGWFFNQQDFKWRKRISDESFAINQDTVVTDNNGTYYLPEGLNYNQYKDIVKKVTSGDISIGRAIANGYDGKIGGYIKFEEAFKLYPKLKDLHSIMALQFKSLSSGFYDYHFSDDEPQSLFLINNTNDTLEERVKYIALHEMQHYVQNVEDFGTGGNQYLASLIDAVGGSSVKEFFISLSAFQKRFREVATLIPLNKYENLIRELRGVKYQNYKVRYNVNMVDVSNYVNQLLSALTKYTQSIELIGVSSGNIGFYFVTMYSMIPETNPVFDKFLNEFVGEQYVDFFKESLEANKTALKRDKEYMAKGFTLRDLYILNFQTYEALMGEIEARYTQQGTKIPQELQDYFALYTTEDPDKKKIAVINNTIFDEFKSEAGIETTSDQKYIIHLPNNSFNTINVLHETGHILYDFENMYVNADENVLEKMVADGYDNIQEYFCACFVDYIHRKNIEPGLTKDLTNERQIKDLKHFDNLFDGMLFTPSEIDENGLILRLGFVNKILE